MDILAIRRLAKKTALTTHRPARTANTIRTGVLMAALKQTILVGLVGLGSSMGYAQQKPWSERMTATVMALWPDSMAIKPGRPARWDYEQGLLLKATEQVWKRSGNGDYFRYVQKHMDRYVEEQGTIRTYQPKDYNIDNVTPGRLLLTLHAETGKEKYQKASFLVRSQLETHPRTMEGGFWHKKIYPNQMWLDGLYMGEPFYAEFAQRFNQPAAFDDIAKQFILMEKHARDPKTGLLYHGWDESKQQKWANPQTGCSPNFWGRSVGWYAMALVDVLDYFPQDHSQREALVSILQRLAVAIANVQDPKSGVWYQVLDKPGKKGNYLEASGSGMFVYALAKGVRNGYLPKKYSAIARKGYEGMLKTFIEEGNNGLVELKGICSVAGLGGNPYRDGSYQYYISEKVVTNDPKGIGPFILASVEMEIAEEQSVGAGKQVGLDYYFNNERRKDSNGNLVRFHYTWEDETNSGFQWWGNIFSQYGAQLVSLADAPTAANLKDLSVYIIVDPDTHKEADRPNYVDKPSIAAITDWVKAGGVLVLMANDSANSEFTHFNELAKQFGIQFNENSLNRVQGTQFETGKLSVPANHPVFRGTRQVYIKELSTLRLSAPAQAALKKENDIIMATAKLGKGTVFAVGDPWLYNEYVNGKKLPDEYENFRAAKELAQWLLHQSGRNEPIR